MDENSGWRSKLAALRSTLDRVFRLKSRLALGVTIASAGALAGLPARPAHATSPSQVVQVSSAKPGKLAGKFILKKTNGTTGKAFAGHGSHSSHSSHSSHRSHRSGAMVL
jgi:hypothetical protein